MSQPGACFRTLKADKLKSRKGKSGDDDYPRIRPALPQFFQDRLPGHYPKREPERDSSKGPGDITSIHSHQVKNNVSTCDQFILVSRYQINSGLAAFVFSPSHTIHFMVLVKHWKS